MKQGLSEIIFILDMTGSMKKLATETVIGFNNFVEEQKKVPGEARLTLVTFNSERTEKVYDHVDLKSVVPMRQDQYIPDEYTPLLDTIGSTIVGVVERLKNTPEDERPEKVIVCIMTDGEENFSRVYNRRQIFDTITLQRKEHGWEFIFLGANQDVYHEAGGIGIDKMDTQSYDPTAKGTKVAYAGMSSTVTERRA